MDIFFRRQRWNGWRSLCELYWSCGPASDAKKLCMRYAVWSLAHCVMVARIPTPRERFLRLQLGVVVYVLAALKVAATVQHSEETKVLKDISHETGIGLAVTLESFYEGGSQQSFKSKAVVRKVNMPSLDGYDGRCIKDVDKRKVT